MGTAFVLMAILSIVVLSKSPETMANSVERMNAFGCHQANITTFIIQEDANGRKCWGNVSIRGCKGYCESFSIPSWKFPYKKSYHPVCIHDQRVEIEEPLSYCEAGVLPRTERYKYEAAGRCKCSICDSSDSSCEGARKRGKPSSPPVQDTNSDVDFRQTPATEERWRWLQFIPQVLRPPVYP